MVAKFYSDKFNQIRRDVKAAYISTYPPKSCGIATFTKDLTTAINMLNPHNLARVIATNHNGEIFDYPWEVLYQIDNTSRNDFIKAAYYLNQTNFDVINIQHEYGIFNDNDYGVKILDFIYNLQKPLVTTVHTTLGKPKNEEKYVLQELIKKSEAIVSLSKTGISRLEKFYGAEPSKLVYIPHGIPDIPLTDSKYYKKLFGYENRIVLGVHGLLSKGKGYEDVIQALPIIKKVHPDILFVIVGVTHPEVKKREGEKYRNYLNDLAKKLNVEDNVRFHNEYLSLEAVLDFIRSFDVYVTPYKNPQQIVSGCLAYAIGCGKAAISTPYIYAKEVLTEDRGIIVNFNSPREIAEQAIRLIENPEYKEQLELESYRYARTMTWVNVASKYLDLFLMVKENAYVPAYQSETSEIVNR